MSLYTTVVQIVNQLLASSKKISELPAGSNPAGSELVEVVQGGQNVKLTISQLGTGGAGDPFTEISSAPSLPIAAKTVYLATADFDFDGTQIYEGSILYAPAGAASVNDITIKP